MMNEENSFEIDLEEIDDLLLIDNEWSNYEIDNFSNNDQGYEQNEWQALY